MESSSLSLDFTASSIKLLKPLRRQRQALLSSQLSMAKVCRIQISPLPVQLGSQLPATAIAAFGSASARAVTVVPSVFGTGIDGVILAKSFKTHVGTIEKIKTGFNTH
ncbi:hypothetical protein ACFX2J_027661 [Malus domestica]